MFRLLVLSVFTLSALLNCQSNNNSDSSNQDAGNEMEATNDSPSTKNPAVIDLDVQAFMKSYHRAENAQLVDVRTAEEIADGKIDNALEMDFYGDQFAEEIKSLDSAKPTYLYCRSGNRSGKAGKMLIDLGFEQVYNLEGGYEAFSKMQKR